MLSTMREKTKVIMVVLAVAFVGWLIFDVGMGATGQTTGSQDIGSVNGRPIRITEWNEAYRIAYEEARQQNPGAVFTREQQRQIEDEAFERLVQAQLLKAEYRRRGITVTDGEIADAVRRFPPQEVMTAPDFRTEGRFDPAKYERFLASSNEQSRSYALAMEARWREDLPRYKLLQQVTGDIYVPDNKLWTIFRDQHDSVWARAMVIRPSQVVADASVRITDEELRAWYDEHEEDFRRTARAVMSFIAIPRLPTSADSVIVMARIRALRDSILRGARFEDIARTESGDTASRDSGGALGTFARGQMVPAFDQAVWRQPLNQVGEPVVTPFGVHIIKVERRTADSAAARHILLPWARMGARLDTLEARADSLDRLAAEQSEPGALDSAARLMSLSVNRGPALIQNVPYSLGRYRIPDVGVWAFEARVGETSPVIETSGAYYVFRLDSLLPAGIPAFEDVAPQVRAALTQQKKAAAAEEIARGAERRIASGDPMEAVAASVRGQVLSLGPFTRTTTVPLLGTASPSLGTAFRLRVGERSGMLRGDDAYFFLQVDRRVSADSTVWLAQRDQQRAETIRAARQFRVQAYMDGLRRSANVKDRRAEVLRPAAQQDETTKL